MYGGRSMQMNRFSKIALAILGGMDATFYMFSPIILAAIWAYLAVGTFSIYLMYTIAFATSIFRAIKIGFIKNA